MQDPAGTTLISLGVLLAGLASVADGLSDTLSGTVVRRHATALLALWAQLTGLVLLGVAAALLRPEVTRAGVACGVCAGVVGRRRTRLLHGPAAPEAQPRAGTVAAGAHATGSSS